MNMKPLSLGVPGLRHKQWHRWVIALAASLALGACQSTNSPTDASLTVSIDRAALSADDAATSRAVTDIPASVVRLVVSISNAATNVEVASGDLIAAGGSTRFTVPDNTALTVSGTAYDANNEAVFTAAAPIQVAPLPPGGSTSASLTLIAVGSEGPALIEAPIQIDLTPAGEPGDGTGRGLISAGLRQRYGLFFSDSTNLLAAASPAAMRLLAKDRYTHSVYVIDSDASGNPGDAPAASVASSSDGRYVVFDSDASNLVAGDSNGRRDVFLKDTFTNEVTRISVNQAGAQSAQGGATPSISGDGRFVVFYSDSALTRDNQSGVFLYDRQSRMLQHIAADQRGFISADGGTVALWNATDGTLRRYALQSGQIQTIAQHTPDAALALSAEGRYIAFLSNERLVSDDTDDLADVYLYDHADASLRRVSSDSRGQALPGNGASAPSLSRGGEYAAFEYGGMIYIKDTRDARLSAISKPGTEPALSADGLTVAYTSAPSPTTNVLATSQTARLRISASAATHVWLEPNPLTTPPQPLPVPEALASTPLDSGLELRWDAVWGATSYNVYVASDPAITADNYGALADGRKLEDVSSPAVVDGLVNGRPYYLIITAVNAGGESAASATVEVIPIDTSPLAVLATVPAADAADTPVNTRVQATFSKPVAAASVTAESFTLDSPAGAITGTISATDTTATFTPNNALALATTHSAALMGVEDLAGHALAGEHRWSFTTQDGVWHDGARVDTVYPVRRAAGSAPQVALDNQGNAIAVWHADWDGSGIFASRFADGHWGAPTHISLGWGNDGEPQVALDAQGNAIAVWLRGDDTIVASHFAPETGWSTALTPLGTTRLGLNGDATPTPTLITMDASGRALVVWLDQTPPLLANLACTQIKYARYDAGQWAEVDKPFGSASTGCFAGDLALAGSATGTTWTVWSNLGRVGAIRFSLATGSWAIVTLGAGSAPRAAVNSNGDAVIVAQTTVANAVHLWAQPVSLAGNVLVPGDAEFVDAADNLHFPSVPHVAVDSLGNRLVIWRQFEANENQARVFANRYVANTGWGTAQAISADEVLANTPLLAMDPNGNAIAVWMAADQFEFNHVAVNRFTVGEGWKGVSALTAPTIDADQVQLAVAQDGTGAVVWRENPLDGFDPVIAARRFESPTTPRTEVFVSNGAWRSSDTEAPGWQNRGFDDSAWVFARAPYPNPTPATAKIPNTTAQYIWHDPNFDSQNGASGVLRAFLRYSFELDAAPIAATAKISVDDDYDFYVNGQRVLENHDGGASEKVDTLDIAGLLTAGTNVFAIEAVDGSWQSPYDLLYESVMLEAIVKLPPPAR
jgi:Tol biopolymer transport system component